MNQGMDEIEGEGERMIHCSPEEPLFVIAAGTLLILFIDIHNAWDNVTYTAIELSQHQHKSQD